MTCSPTKLTRTLSRNWIFTTYSHMKQEEKINTSNEINRLKNWDFFKANLHVNRICMLTFPFASFITTTSCQKHWRLSLLVKKALFSFSNVRNMFDYAAKMVFISFKFSYSIRRERTRMQNEEFPFNFILRLTENCMTCSL